MLTKRRSSLRVSPTIAGIIIATTLLMGCQLFKPKNKAASSSPSVTAMDCGAEGQPDCPPTPTPSWMTGKMNTFASEEQWRLYMNSALQKMQSSRGYANDGATEAMSAEAAQSNELVTNNQEVGVDEGGIVKNIGDHLVILRKGTLTTINISQPGTPRKTSAVSVASSPELAKDVWYDELLVRGNVIVVTGFRFNITLSGSETPQQNGAVEINTFILEDGNLRRVQQLWFEANDYFSGSNFATRLIDDDLTLYMPFNAVTWTDQGLQPRIPRIFSRIQNGFQPEGNLVDWGNIWFPPEMPASPKLHVLTKCKLAGDAKLSCLSKALVGGPSEQYYVSANNIWLWSYPSLFKFDIAQMVPEVHKVKGFGNPVDQFSFKEMGETIHIVTLDERSDRGSIYDVDHTLPDESTPLSETTPQSESPVIHDSVVNLLSLPLAAFDDTGTQTLSGEHAFKIAQEKGWLQVIKQRWIGDKLVAALVTQRSTSSAETPKPKTSLHVVSSTSKTSKWIEWRQEVSRIERLDDQHVVVFGTEQKAANEAPVLRVSTVEIAEEPKVRSSEKLPNLNEGETRSHGFFWKPAEQGGGRFGLAVINDGDSGWFGNGVSNVAWFGVGSDWSLKPQGITSSTGKREETCATSCVDWYGNTRPIFLGKRTFALMGHELVEVLFAEHAALDLGTRLTF